MKKFIAIQTSVVLIGCSQPSNKSSKGGSTFDRTGEPIAVTIMVYPDLDTLNARYKETHPEDRNAKRILGWASYYKQPTRNNSCTIHVTEPQGALDTEVLETWGHELAHCAYGSYHAR